MIVYLFYRMSESVFIAFDIHYNCNVMHENPLRASIVIVGYHVDCMLCVQESKYDHLVGQ